MSIAPVPFRIDCLDGVLAGRMSPEEWKRIVAFREQPTFLLGLPRYGALMPDYFSDNVILNKVVTEVWRFEMLVYLLYLFDTRNPDDPRSGLTVANLQKLCAQQNCASRGRVLAILGIMRLGGYLRRIKSPRDSRVVLLEPSERFVEIVEGWNHRIFQIIDAVVPEDALAARHGAHPRMSWEMRTRGAESLLGGWKLLDPFPEVNHFVSRDGGWMLLLTCVAKALAQDNGVIRPVSLELQSFGARFGVSRSHLRRLLESAWEARLLDAPPRNGADIRLSPALVAAFLTCMASELAFYQRHAVKALAAGIRPAPA